MNKKTTEKILKTVDYLEARWQDEKEYEDWNDYVADMKNVVQENGLSFIKATKRPFGVTAGNGKHIFSFLVKGNQLVLETHDL